MRCVVCVCKTENEGASWVTEMSACMCVGVKRVERDWGGSAGRSSRACTSEGEVDTAFVGVAATWCAGA